MQITFGVIADPQYDDQRADTIGRYFRTSLTRAKAAIDFFNQQPLDFVVVLGDLVDTNPSAFSLMLELLKTSRHPLRLVAGNHDYRAAKNSETKLAQILGLKSTKYTFQTKGYHFIVLDTNDGPIKQTPPPTDPEKTDQAKELETKNNRRHTSNSHMWNGLIEPPQLHWLQTALSNSDQPTLILAHDPVFPPTMDTLRNNWEVLEILENSPHPPLAYLSGHHHDGSFAVRQNIAHLNFKGMVQTPHNAYSIVTITPHQLRTQGFGRENSYTIPF
jgi:3',5'-cyclic AMP phosphodiesterase CpdA